MELRPHQKTALKELHNGSDEEWVEIQDFPDYSISNYGEVYSWKTNKLLTPSMVNGYARIFFTVNSVIYGKMAHRLVAEAFIPGWSVGLEVNHIDGNKLNNHESNLEWVTPSENTKHAYAIGLRKPNRKRVII